VKVLRDLPEARRIVRPGTGQFEPFSEVSVTTCAIEEEQPMRTIAAACAAILVLAPAATYAQSVAAPNNDAGITPGAHGGSRPDTGNGTGKVQNSAAEESGRSESQDGASTSRFTAPEGETGQSNK
jgi:hypothetical protein